MLIISSQSLSVWCFIECSHHIVFYVSPWLYIFHYFIVICWWCILCCVVNSSWYVLHIYWPTTVYLSTSDISYIAGATQYSTIYVQWVRFKNSSVYCRCFVVGVMAFYMISGKWLSYGTQVIKRGNNVFLTWLCCIVSDVHVLHCASVA